MTHPYFKKCAALFIALAIVGGGIGSFPRETAAIPVTEVGVNLYQNILQALKAVEGTVKEFSLDGIANAVAKATISSLTKSIVGWINSGFDGNPAFITNLEGFLQDVADEAAAEFIASLDEETQAFLCTPFDLDYRIALTLNYYDGREGALREENRCSLDEVFAKVEDVEEFIDGNFSKGGWQGWFEISVKPHNNPYGRMLYLEQELEQRVAGATMRSKSELDWGDGFLSNKVCGDEVFAYERDFGGATTDGSRDYGVDDEGCIIVTPGKTIENQLSTVLGSGVRQLELADEFNEIIGALTAQLAQQVLTGANGLLGVSQAEAGTSGQSYLDRTSTEVNQRGKEYYISALEVAITTEKSYKENKAETFNIVSEADQTLFALETCLQTKSAGDPALAATFSFATSSRERINTVRTTLSNQLTDSDEASALLDDLLVEADTLESVDLEEAIGSLESLRRSDTIHDSRDVESAAKESGTLSREMQTIGTQAEQRRLAACGVI